MLENITWGLIRDLKCTLRFLFSLEWICYCKSQKKNWKNFLNHQLITQIKISLIEQAQVELKSSNISHQLQTQTSTISKAPKVSTALVSQQPRYRRPARWLVMQTTQPDAPHTFVYRKEPHNQLLAHIPSLLTLQVEPNLKTIFQDPLSRSSKVFAFRSLHR